MENDGGIYHLQTLVLVNGERVLLPFDEMSVERFLDHISKHFARDMTGMSVVVSGNRWGPYPAHQFKILRFLPEQRVVVE